MKTVFIDGQHGTTGLKIVERLKPRDDIEMIEIPVEKRKDPAVKRTYLNEADVVFLCLPDDAARESVAQITNPKVRVIDPSTAHRTNDNWTFGIPELNPSQRDAIRRTTRLSNPGCYATGFILSAHPLVASGIMPKTYPATAYSITGYSGGGRQMIANFEAAGQDPKSIAARPKNLNLAHKHVPEMQKYGLLSSPPLFVPIVGNFYNGMLVFVPLHLGLLSKTVTADSIRDLFAQYYANEKFVKVMSKAETEAVGDGFVSPLACNETNRLELFVFARGEQVLIVTRFDNLGKGASGAAVQNMNIMLGIDEGKGL
jgi:N-acetyl-gamma-glutamyl-phosphate reductase